MFSIKKLFTPIKEPSAEGLEAARKALIKHELNMLIPEDIYIKRIAKQFAKIPSDNE